MADSLILVELLLAMITATGGYVAHRARQIWQKMDTLTEQVNTNSRILVGKEGEPYDGIVPEVTENSGRIKQHRQLLKKLQRALNREGILSEREFVIGSNDYYRRDDGDNFYTDGRGEQ